MISTQKRQKAFTLAEIFMAMVILSVLVSVCMTFFVKRHDYEREYFYYTAYKNIVNVVDSALFNDQYLKISEPRIENTVCGTSGDPKKCRAFKAGMNATNGLCSIFKDYFNTSPIYNNSGTEVAACANVTPDPTGTTAIPALRLTNGIDIYFENNSSVDLSDLAEASLLNPETTGYHIWVDINGRGEGEDKLHYDIFEFYITRSGKVVPVYGEVEGLRGYDYVPKEMDGGGNNELMAFDVVYNPEPTTTNPIVNHLVVIGDDYRSVSFPLAACASGYIASSTPYCTGFKYDCNASGQNCQEGVTKAAVCTNDYADCKVRLVKKLKRLK